ncbi:MAG TPA: hypothetical protein PK671_08780, partial [Candidatus Obscuribacter sp.]|nr:hypothetical protein [Candidatus Obscuribacter sp.]
PPEKPPEKPPTEPPPEKPPEKPPTEPPPEKPPEKPPTEPPPEKPPEKPPTEPPPEKPPEKPPTEPPPEKPPEKPPTEPHCTVDCGPPPPPPPPPEKPEEPSRNVNTANADANANAAGGKVNMVTRQGAATMPVLTSTSECAEARAFGINLFVIGVGAGEQWLNQTCEQIKTVKAVCGIANENTSLAIEALKIAGSVNENRFEQRLATRISHDKAWDGRRVNANCAVEKTKLENMLAEQREKTEED